MKKILLASLMLISIIALQGSSKAEEVGIGDIIFEETPTQSIAHGFLINEFSYNLIRLHIFLAGKDIETVNYEGETLATIKKLEELVKTNIITTLDLSADKEVALTTYLAQCDQELQKGDTISAYIKQELNVIKDDMEACIKDKDISDKSYFDAIDRYDQNIMNVSLNESIKYETCATENRIQYNAKTSILRKLVFYLGLLQKKYDILFAKQDILTKNFTVFRDNILPDLNQIDDLLQQYKF